MSIMHPFDRTATRALVSHLMTGEILGLKEPELSGDRRGGVR